ncbi:MAG TPA: hypothetical protein VIK55_11700 [Paludibacter sp.]
MTEEELLQAIRVEIREAFRQDREATIKDFCKRIGFDLTSENDFISQKSHMSIKYN